MASNRTSTNRKDEVRFLFISMILYLMQHEKLRILCELQRRTVRTTVAPRAAAERGEYCTSLPPVRECHGTARPCCK